MRRSDDKQFITGAEVVVRAAKDAGAEIMYGYPITPATEVFTGWIRAKEKYLQTEDEIAAGFAVCGAIIAGQKAFTATAGPGHVLMQDALSMSEGMRLPFVAIVAQRGGPSSGTVIYSQQEVTLACLGGNGEGLRFVYSPSSLEELYILTRQAFNDAWQYRFPSILLTDGYLLKTRGVVDWKKIPVIKNIAAKSVVASGANAHLQNIYTLEEELYQKIGDFTNDFKNASAEIMASEEVETQDADILVVAHGIVGASAVKAVKNLRAQKIKAGLFRPITLQPFDNHNFDRLAQKARCILVVESSLGQLARIARFEMAPEIATPMKYLQSPAQGIEPEQIEQAVKDLI
ncbi:MAG: transketolase C-terminal domain-containing protein [Candidatus Magasanikbacteria bacterium]